MLPFYVALLLIVKAFKFFSTELTGDALVARFEVLLHSFVARIVDLQLGLTDANIAFRPAGAQSIGEVKNVGGAAKIARIVFQRREFLLDDETTSEVRHPAVECHLHQDHFRLPTARLKHFRVTVFFYVSCK